MTANLHLLRRVAQQYGAVAVPAARCGGGSAATTKRLLLAQQGVAAEVFAYRICVIHLVSPWGKDPAEPWRWAL